MLGKKGPRVEIAVIGGWMAYHLLSSGGLKGERRGRIDTPYGGSQPIYLMSSEQTPFYFLSRHGESSYSLGASFVNYRANIYALKELGVRQIVSWSACGAIRGDYELGQVVVIDDGIDETRSREGTFFRFRGLGLNRQNDVLCPTIRGQLIDVLQRRKLDHANHGVYVCTEGPRLETPAEVRKYARFGGDLVGMTLVPEVFLAKELEMCYATLGVLTNYAEGVKDRRYRAGGVVEGLRGWEDARGAVRQRGRLPQVRSQRPARPLLTVHLLEHELPH